MVILRVKSNKLASSYNLSNHTPNPLLKQIYANETPIEHYFHHGNQKSVCAVCVHCTHIIITFTFNVSSINITLEP